MLIKVKAAVYKGTFDIFFKARLERKDDRRRFLAPLVRDGKLVVT